MQMDDEKSQQAQIGEIKEEWRQLWLGRIEDKVRAEGIADRAFPLCFVDRGTVIVATRDYKPLDLREILSLNLVQNAERVVGPPSSLGGWRKFSRTVLSKQARNRRLVLEEPRKGRANNLQAKKGGRGWTHRI